MRLHYELIIFLTSALNLIKSNIVEDYDEEKLIACHDILNQKIINDKRQINSVGYGAKKYIGQENVLKKVYSDMIFKCYSTIDKEHIEKIIKNSVYLAPDYESEGGNKLLEFMKVDFSEYNNLNPNEFYVSPSNLSLYNKFQIIEPKYKEIIKKINERLKNEFHFLGFSLNAIPKKVKLFIFLAFFTIIIVFVLKLLVNLMNTSKKAAPPSKKKNKFN